MKSRVINLFFLLLVTQNVVAQLISLGVIEDSLHEDSDYRIEFYGDYLYASSSQGLYRFDLSNSTDGWEKLSICDSPVVDFEVRGDTILVLTNNQLFTSTNEGTTIIDVISPDESKKKLTGFAVHPSNTKKIHVAFKHGLSYTEDGGGTWMLIDSLMAIEDLIYNSLDEKNLIGYYNGGDTYVYVSTDGGFKWEQSEGYYSSSRTCESIAFHPTDKNRVVMCGYGNYAISNDQGSSWTTIGNEPSNPDMGIQLSAHLEYVVYDPRSPEVLYGADWTNYRDCKIPILRSRDGGLSWETIYTIGLKTPNSVYCMCIKNNLLAMSIGGEDCSIYLLDVDAINTSVSPIVDDGSESACYDLMGRKVTHPTRGIYIKDGRKVIVDRVK